MTTNPVILVVDDEELIRSVIADVLEAEGYVVIGAPGSRAALELLSSGAPPPALILLDLVMDGGDGWELLWARRDDVGLVAIPVVVISAVPRAELSIDDLSVDAVLRKPFPLEALVATIARLAPPGRAARSTGGGSSSPPRSDTAG